MQNDSYDLVNELVSKRLRTIGYLRRTHEGSTHWFNAVLLSREDLGKMYQNSRMKKRTFNFYILGFSLGPLFDILLTQDYIKAVSQLLNEFEFHTNEHSKPKMKMFFRKSKVGGDDSFQETGEYTYLYIPNAPFDMDYIQTFFTLTDILIEVYHKFLSGAPEVYTPAFCELVLKVDGKFKKIFSLVTKELDALAKQAIKEELEMIDPFSSMKNGGFNMDDWDT